MTLTIKNDKGEPILFLIDIEDKTATELHVEISTTIENELDKIRGEQKWAISRYNALKGI